MQLAYSAYREDRLRLSLVLGLGDMAIYNNNTGGPADF